MSARYVVNELEGYSEHRPKPAITWTILDTAVCHRVVHIHRGVTRSTNPFIVRRNMEARCAELNAEHDAWARENGYPS